MSAIIFKHAVIMEQCIDSVTYKKYTDCKIILQYQEDQNECC
jgi:hypothetical protein